MTAIAADGCDGTSAHATCSHTCVDAGYEGGSIACSADGSYAVAACTIRTNHCDASEPSLGADMTAIGTDGCDGTSAHAACAHTCVDAGYEGGSVTCSADGTYAVSACTARANHCDASEPSLGADMRAIGTDGCDGTSAHAACAHTCADAGYEGGSVTCSADGSYAVTACVGSVAAEVVLSMDIGTIPMGSAARQQFVVQFAVDLAARLSSIAADQVLIKDIRSGSTVVAFAIVPDPSGSIAEEAFVFQVREQLIAVFAQPGVPLAGSATASAIDPASIVIALTPEPQSGRTDAESEGVTVAMIAAAATLVVCLLCVAWCVRKKPPIDDEKLRADGEVRMAEEDPERQQALGLAEGVRVQRATTSEPERHALLQGDTIGMPEALPLAVASAPPAASHMYAIAGTTAAVPSAAPSSVLSELQRLRMSELRKRAAAAGISKEDIEKAGDADEPKKAIIALIVAAPREQGASAPPADALRHVHQDQEYSTMEVQELTLVQRQELLQGQQQNLAQQQQDLAEQQEALDRQRALQAEACEQFMAVCPVDEPTARSYLMSAGWDLQGAIDSHLGEQRKRELLVAQLMEERYADESTARQCLEAAGWDIQQAMAMYMPPMPDDWAVSGRTLAASKFKVAYTTVEVPEGPMELGVILSELIRAYCKTQGIDWKEEGQPFFRKLQREAMTNAEELIGEIPQAAQRMWTSALRLRGREFCYILNAAVRSDLEELSDPTAGLTRAINLLCVTAAGSTDLQAAVHPADNVCFRGGGFDDRYRSFYVSGRHFRQPAYLATSFSRAVASEFIGRSDMPSKVLWLVRIDPQRKCLHVNLVKRSNVHGEEEYLFAPYSAFTVIRVQWNAGSIESPHVIELLAAVDNKEAPEDLPLAPWS